MYSKLAKRNMKRSLKDYTIYFLTLVFGVCIFYTFNAIEAQKVIMKLNEYQAHNFSRLDKLMSVVSIFIACVLGFLIIYANNYLIKRRKKEFGVYLTLGMEKRKVSRILLFETIIIGAFSLIAGLVLGIFLSQGISVFTAKLFHVDMQSFKFIFSARACIKTITYFGIMYLIVFLFNSRCIGKIQLIDLLTDGRKNEKVRLKSIKVSVIVFIASIIFIGGAYYTMLKIAVDLMNMFTFIAIILGVIGTFLFFFSLTGFLLKIVQKSKKLYLRELNMFLLRQLNSKINTTFISMSFICLMLFISICMLASGFSISKTLNRNIDDLSQYDASLMGGKVNVPIDEFLEKNNIKLSDYANKYVKYNDYMNKGGEEQLKLQIKKFLGEEEASKYNSYFDVAHNSIIPIMKLSDFNNIMELTNKKKIDLNNGEYAVFSDLNGLIEPIQKALDNKTKIEVNRQELIPSRKPVIEVTIRNDLNKRNFCTFIVRDEVAEGLEKGFTFLNINFKGDKLKTEQDFSKAIAPLVDNNQIFSVSKESVRADSFGMGAMICYLGIYIGIIFLITSAVLLALQQLSESADNIERYKLLKKIGVDDEMINKTILFQVGIYFLLPLILALIHAIVGLKVAKVVVDMLGTGEVKGQLIVTTVLFVIIYGGYFLITYTGAKKMVKSNS
ncbi:putative ABC transport system permease protein [Clostridium cavendishii DSM 21758]|uniref:Putative ABC transport system permease protein n=1 Tax=Clostridium cavendishii DSM 21758 TaxID=1121302 RepID=A0A1M6E894_9CLOT|nr:FtsX-like permease family protein [Clostridium cavendishii]SHI81589.1 putative ABC transport system permease protein [Clostridium cavendishii DSM 21758]